MYLRINKNKLINYTIKFVPSLLGTKPNFLGIGAAKAGTTKIASLLRQHPEIYMPEKKELHFFDNDSMMGDHDLIWYFSQFKKRKAIGEFTPSYLFVPESPNRICTVLGKEIKFIVSLRNPVDRAYSHYCHAVNNWYEDKYRKLNYPIETLCFEDAIKNEQDRLKQNKYHSRHLAYFKKGLYAEQLERYFKTFSRRNFYIYLLEEFAENPEKVLKEVCSFLGVDFNHKFQNLNGKINSQSNQNISLKTRYLLNNKYRESVIKLEQMLGRDFKLWNIL